MAEISEAVKAPETKKFKVYVRDIPLTATAESVKELFTRAGDVVELVLLDSRDKKSKIAFVTFSTQEELDTAITLSGQEVDGSAIQVQQREERLCFKCNKPGHRAVQCRSGVMTPKPGYVARDFPARKPRERERQGREKSRSRSRSRDRRRRSRSRSRDRRRDRSRSRERHHRSRSRSRDEKKRRL